MSINVMPLNFISVSYVLLFVTMKLCVMGKLGIDFFHSNLFKFTGLNY